MPFLYYFTRTGHHRSIFDSVDRPIDSLRKATRDCLSALERSPRSNPGKLKGARFNRGCNL
eukprot:345040-Pyramimonas_sp.AAC.1